MEGKTTDILSLIENSLKRVSEIEVLTANIIKDISGDAMIKEAAGEGPSPRDLRTLTVSLNTRLAFMADRLTQIRIDLRGKDGPAEG